ncbi:MAG: pilus assembly protein [Bacteroidales bacterium]
MSRAVCGLVALFVIAAAGSARAQLDPLLFLKTTKPNVLLVVETTNRMQYDADNTYYDQFVYRRGETWDGVLGVGSANTSQAFRRKYLNLQYADAADRFETDRIAVVGDLEPAYATFDARSRIGVARLGLSRAITLNLNVARFGLITTRQLNPTLGTLLNNGPVADKDPGQLNPTDGGGNGEWKITRPTVDVSNSSLTAVTPARLEADAAGTNNSIVAYLAKAPHQGGLLPAGQDSKNVVDAPIKYMLDDAKAEAARLFGDGVGCRNTVAVLVVGGGEGTASLQDPAAAANAFRAINGHRVPIYVIAIAPPAAAVAQLQAIADNSGGQFVEITKAMIEAAPQGIAVPEVVRAVNIAVQHAFAAAGDVNTAPTASLPYGPSTEFQVTSPIVGTVNLANGKDINGNPLVNSVVTLSNGVVIPQRSNVLLTTGFALPGPITTPGFPGRLRAFRAYRPERDTSRTSGFRFVGDGTALWVARPPTAAEGGRNVYTSLPDGTVLPFVAGNAHTLQPYLNDSDPGGLITYVRSLPLGGFVDSTPAVLDVPSLSSPADVDYVKFAAANEQRRTLVFVGGNDGMMHAFDGRTGVEVWAFVPFNLLPKLRTLREGQAAGKFQFFADGSPKLADVKTLNGWRSVLIFGEGPGGTFYQAFDVTLPDISAFAPPDSDDVTALLSYFAAVDRAPRFMWSFPSYQSFDCSLSTSATPFGDLKSSASSVEKSVGQTWSDPATGQVQDASGEHVVLVGSGFLPHSIEQQPNRGGTRAGTTLYVIDAVSGAVVDYKDVGDDGVAETVDDCAAVGDCSRSKNAIQSAPLATGRSNSGFLDTAYVGDLDGRLWRFTLGLDGGRARITVGPSKLFDVGSAQPIFSSPAVASVGAASRYLFFATGSDLLPSVGVKQSFRLFGIQDDAGGGSQAFVTTLAAVDGSTGAGEKVSAYPAVAGDIVFFTTTTFSASTCTPPDANVYALTFRGGAVYDNTGDDRVDKTDTPKVVVLARAGRATAPFIADRHLVLAAGGQVQFLGDPQEFNNAVERRGIRILSWREIR